MMSSVETRLDGSTLLIRIPLRFQRRGEGIGKSCLSRILRLALVAPDTILAGRTDQAMMLESWSRPLLASWEEHHARIAEPKMS